MATLNFRTMHRQQLETLFWYLWNLNCVAENKPLIPIQPNYKANHEAHHMMLLNNAIQSFKFNIPKHLEYSLEFQDRLAYAHKLADSFVSACDEYTPDPEKEMPRSLPKWANTLNVNYFYDPNGRHGFSPETLVKMAEDMLQVEAMAWLTELDKTYVNDGGRLIMFPHQPERVLESAAHLSFRNQEMAEKLGGLILRCHDHKLLSVFESYVKETLFPRLYANRELILRDLYNS